MSAFFVMLTNQREPKAVLKFLSVLQQLCIAPQRTIDTMRIAYSSCYLISTVYRYVACLILLSLFNGWNLTTVTLYTYGVLCRMYVVVGDQLPYQLLGTRETCHAYNLCTRLGISDVPRSRVVIPNSFSGIKCGKQHTYSL